MVMGCSGGGKSSLAIRLSKISGLRLIHMDKFYYHPNWMMCNKDDIIKNVLKVIEGDGWVFDGNHSSTHDVRAQKSQMIIWVDIARWRCIYNVILRSWHYRGQTRPDMAEGCNEQLTWDFIKFIWNFKYRGNVKIAKVMDDNKHRLVVFRLKNYVEIDVFVERFENGEFEIDSKTF